MELWHSQIQEHTFESVSLKVLVGSHCIGNCCETPPARGQTRTEFAQNNLIIGDSEDPGARSSEDAPIVRVTRVRLIVRASRFPSDQWLWPLWSSPSSSVCATAAFGFSSFAFPQPDRASALPASTATNINLNPFTILSFSLSNRHSSSLSPNVHWTPAINASSSISNA